MNGPLFDDLLDQLRGAPLQQLAGSLGLPEEATHAAITTALPVLLGALHRNTRNSGGAESLLAALADHRGVDPTNALGNALAGGGTGGAILDHLLGRHRSAAAEAVGNASGIGADRGGQLLRMLAPVVMAYLARRLSTPRDRDGASTPEPSPDGLRSALADEVMSLRRRDDLHPAALTSLDEQDDADTTGFTEAGPLTIQTAEMRSPRPLL